MDHSSATQACLLLHGFTGSPHEIEPLAQYLERHGWVCDTPTLAGHGEDSRSMRDTQWQEWVASGTEAAERLERSYGQFDLVGFSMGGLIAAYLANRHRVRRLVLLNAAVIYMSPVRFAQAALEQWKEDRSVRRLLSKTHQTPLFATWQFSRLVRQLKPEFSRIRVPVLIVQGERDQVIHPSSARYIADQVQGEKELRWFLQSRHMICQDKEADELFRTVLAFLQK